MFRPVMKLGGNGLVAKGLSLVACSCVLGLASVGAQTEGGAASASEQEEAEYQEWLDALAKLDWRGDGMGDLDGAEIEIPEGFRFTGASGAQSILEMTGNVPSASERGILAPSDHFDFWILFRFDEVGYVNDDEKDSIDADDLMSQMQEGQEASNAQRKDMGLDALYVDGWALAPQYNEETNNLEWAIRLRGEDGTESVNFKTKLLGRYGVTDVVLVCDPEDLEQLMGTTQELLQGFTYQDGNRYAEYKDGDKVAEYGLTALVLGGAGVLAAKAGLFAVIAKFFAKMWKLIIVAVIAVGAFIKKIFGKSESPYQG